MPRRLASTGSEALVIRRARVGDAATIAWHRAAMFRDMGELGPDEFGKLRAASEAWLGPYLENGEYVGWLVEDGGSVVAGGGLLLLKMLPAPGLCRQGRRALIGNIYTEATHRRRGLARAVMHAILEWCEANQIEHVSLAASREGEPLYRSLGFEHDAMAMKLPRTTQEGNP